MIGCSDRYVGKSVNAEGMRIGTQVVRGKDGKSYKVEPKPEKSAENIELPTPEKSFEKVLTALKLSDVDDQQRVQSFVDVVKAMASRGFKDDQYRQEFIQMLQSEITAGAHTS
jgi:hypothetical protein